jgi:hypothetical protein
MAGYEAAEPLEIVLSWSTEGGQSQFPCLLKITQGRVESHVWQLVG